MYDISVLTESYITCVLSYVSVYVSGLVCFQTPSQEVESCANSMVSKMTEVTMKQIRDNLNVDDFMTEYCR